MWMDLKAQPGGAPKKMNVSCKWKNYGNQSNLMQLLSKTMKTLTQTSAAAATTCHAALSLSLSLEQSLTRTIILHALRIELCHKKKIQSSIFDCRSVTSMKMNL